MKNLSKAAHNIEGQPMFKLLAHVLDLERQGKNIIHFEIGDPDFDTPINIKEAACSSIMDGETHYTSSLGLMDMRIVICDATEISRGFRPKLSQVLVTPGANIIVYYAIRCLVEPDEEAIIPDPGFPTYLSTLKFCGVKPVFVSLKEENEFRMNPDDIREKIKEMNQKDYILYEEAKRLFGERVRKYEGDIKTDLSNFRRDLKKWKFKKRIHSNMKNNKLTSIMRRAVKMFNGN